MSAIVPMLDAFVQRLEADRAEVVARLEQAAFLTGLDGRQRDVQKQLEQMLRSMDDTRDRVAAMRAGAAQLDQQWVDTEPMRNRQLPALPSPVGWAPGNLEEKRIAAAAERLVARVHIAAAAQPPTRPTAGDVASMTSGSWEAPASDSGVSSAMNVPEDRPPASAPSREPRPRRGDDVHEMGTGDWK